MYVNVKVCKFLLHAHYKYTIYGDWKENLINVKKQKRNNLLVLIA